MENVTALGIVVLIILLTDRWVVRIFSRFTEHLERVELSHQQMILLLVKNSEDSSAIKEILAVQSDESLTEDD